MKARLPRCKCGETRSECFYRTNQYTCKQCLRVYCQERRERINSRAVHYKRIRDPEKTRPVWLSVKYPKRPYTPEMRIFETAFWILLQRSWFFDGREDVSRKLNRLIGGIHTASRRERSWVEKFVQGGEPVVAIRSRTKGGGGVDLSSV